MLLGRQALKGLNGGRAEAHNNLVDSLRRQLMHDNYDYMTSASDDLLMPAPRQYDDAAAGPLADDADYFPEPSPARPLHVRPPHRRARSRRQRPRARSFAEDEPQAPALEVPFQRVESNVPVSNKDLYYYVDDARLNGGPDEALAFNVLEVADAPDQDFDDEAPPAPPRKKKYSILEVLVIKFYCLNKSA